MHSPTVDMKVELMCCVCSSRPPDGSATFLRPWLKVLLSLAEIDDALLLRVVVFLTIGPVTHSHLLSTELSPAAIDLQFGAGVLVPEGNVVHLEMGGKGEGEGRGGEPLPTS